MTVFAYTPPANHARRNSELLRHVDFPEEAFEIKSYSKSELADMYGVHINTLAKWINRHYDKFVALGYHKRLKVLDPAMVKLFVEIFSTP